MNNSGPEAAASRWHWLYTISAVSALTLDILFLIAAIRLVVSALQPGTVDNWPALIQNNWLVVLFKLNAGFSGVHLGMLDLNLLDSILMVLACIALLGLYPICRQISKTWAAIAVAQPFLGLVLFIITRMAGRLGIMSAVLIVSIMLLRSDDHRKSTSVVGILAGILTIVGDGFTEVTFSIINSTLIAIGYVLMMVWFFVISLRLFRLGRLGKGQSEIGAG